MDCDGIQHFSHKKKNGVHTHPHEEISHADKLAIQSGISDDE